MPGKPATIYMKTLIPRLAVLMLAVLTLGGCGDKLPRDSAYTQTTNDSPPIVRGPGGLETNLPNTKGNPATTNNLPDIITNPPATTN